MNQSENHSQLTHPQNTYKRFKRSVVRLCHRLRCKNTAPKQEELANTGRSDVQHRLDISVGGLEPAIANTGTSGSHTQTQVCHASHNHSEVLPEEITPDVMQSNTFFQNAHGFSISGNPYFQNNVTHVHGGRTDDLEKLERFVSFDAQFDSSVQDPNRRCHPGTRENVLKRLRNWIDNPKANERIFWLYGPAGAGKSAIAQTIADLHNQPKVAATFFFFRTDVNRNDGNRLFTTLAYQLALSMPAIRVYIAKSLSERPDLPRTGVETQFNKLLAHPFQILSVDATQQLAPAVHIIIDIFKKYRESAPVIVIDGIDECKDENLQQRFLKVIGDTVADNRFPLRFLIVSRPERHIEQTIGRFQKPILRIDLAKLDGASQDIKKYLVDEFSRIAFEQDLGPTWPGQEIIDDIVYKSSGNFIFAKLVIIFVSDPDNIAETQLDIVRNIKPPTIMTPFAVLDQLFLEILRRVPDQDFLKRYLFLFTARIAVASDYGELYKDDAVLMDVSEKELHAKLSRMRSLLRLEVERQIDVHHRSFIDFLHDSSRSGQYYIRKPSGARRYLELFIDPFIRHVSTVIKQPDHHNAPHYAPACRVMVKGFPPKIRLSIDEWQKVTQPLLDLQDNLLQFPTSTRDLLSCNQCTVVHMLRELLYLGQYLEIFRGQPNTASVGGAKLPRKVHEHQGFTPSITYETEKDMSDDDLDSVLALLFVHLREIIQNLSPTERVINLVSAILRFDHAETAARMRSVPDAQELVDLLVYLINEKNALSRIHPDAMRKTTLLALDIFARVPILPLSPFLNGNNKLHPHPSLYGNIPVQILSQTIIASRILDRRYTVPVLVSEEKENYVILASGDTDLNELSMKEWRQRLIPSSVTAIQIMLGLAKVIQYFHSMGVVLNREFGSRDVFLDSGLRPRIRCLFSTSESLLHQEWKKWFSLENNIFSFGCLFYELFSGVDTKPQLSCEERMRIITQRPSVPEIPEHAWQLIKSCCTKHPENQMAIDEVVQEMEHWKIK